MNVFQYSAADSLPYSMEERVTSDIPTTLHRSKFDCPVPEEMVTVSVDGSVLDRIAKIMTYLRLGSSGKVLKKKKKERDVKGSDDEDDLSKMDMGGRAKGRLHRWDFETEEEWAKYNYEKEAMPKAAFQFGVKMQDGRKTRKRTRTRSLRMTSIRSTRSWLGRRVRKMGQKMVVTTMNR